MAETALEFYMFLVQLHGSLSQVLVEGHPPLDQGRGVGHLAGTWQLCLQLCVWRSLGCACCSLTDNPRYGHLRTALRSDTRTTFLSSSLSLISSPTLNPARTGILSLGLFSLLYSQMCLSLLWTLRRASGSGCSLLWATLRLGPCSLLHSGCHLHLSVLTY